MLDQLVNMITRNKTGDEKTRLLLLFEILSVFFVYTTAWLGSALISRRLWGGYRGREDDYFVLFLFYILPLILLIGYVWWVNKNRIQHTLGTAFWLIILAFVILNVLILKIPFQRYGDQNQLNYLLSTGTHFPRYLVGSESLEFIYQNLIASLFLPGGMPEPDLTDAFIRIFGSLVMVFTSLLLLRKYPGRLSILLPLSIPAWFLFSSGYNEYYPFITPLFMLCLLFLDQKAIEKVHPILVGLLAAVVALVYAAFVPLSLFLLGLYFLRAGIKRGAVALLFAVGWVFALIAIFWKGPLEGFIQQYAYTLNLGDENSAEQFLGQAFGMTPFFKPVFAFSADHLKMMFFMLFWAGGISSTLILLGMIVLLAIKGDLKQKKFIVPALFLLYQFVYFFFMIPKLGPLKDIDLFFSVYLTIAFTAGLLVDHYVKGLPQQKCRWVSLICFALVAGNTVFSIYYLLLWGIPLRY